MRWDNVAVPVSKCEGFPILKAQPTDCELAALLKQVALWVESMPWGITGQEPLSKPRVRLAG